MALLPYANRVTTQRGGGRDRGERGDRGDRGDRGRADGPPPRPDAPPPASGEGDEPTLADVESIETDVLVDVGPAEAGEE